MNPTRTEERVELMLRNHVRAGRIALVLGTGAAILLVLLAFHPTRAAVNDVDRAVFHFMVRIRFAPLTWIALALNVLGAGMVTWPVRIGTVAYLAVRRRWWFLAAFVLAIAVSEPLISILKVAYHRARPPGSLVHTSGASFPSGHAMATAVTAMALVFVLVRPGPARRKWEVRAVAFTLLMGISRAYLAAHWLSDAVAGVLIGSTVAVASAVGAQLIHDRMALRAVRKATPEEAAREMPEQPGPLETAAVEEESSGNGPAPPSRPAAGEGR
jgi:membrane-associated phospholipid phosphatase